MVVVGVGGEGVEGQGAADVRGRGEEVCEGWVWGVGGVSGIGLG